VIEIPLFPLRSVLCPGVALPLHIFEARYRLLVDRCIERGEPFGVVLLQQGREVGPFHGRVAAVGTTAAIRRAGAHPDGRLEILTVGQQRFRLEGVDNVSEPYLVGRAVLLDEPTGSPREAAELADRVGQRFLEYLELLQADDATAGPEIEIEIEIEVEDEDENDPESASESEPEGPITLDNLLASGEAGDPVEAAEAAVREMDTQQLTPEQRRELLMSAARRLTGTDDPTALSYIISALVQVDLSDRQSLLEAPDTVERLRLLERLLDRESWFLGLGLRPIIVDPRQLGRHLG
jgi:Lon protease-like protein